jgi:TolB-like protein/DNA-binding winged helix-turn-helix (wHTH) protein/Tfp pilus assembly protein PilF
MNPAPDTGVAAFVVGDLHIDVGQQRVTRAGNDIALPNLSFRMLLALVRAAPNVLDNDALMAEVWPGLVVSPETINKRVNLLRDALDDNAQEPSFIAGLRGRGYRLVAPVARAEALGPSATTPAPVPVQSLEPPPLAEIGHTTDRATNEATAGARRPWRIAWIVAVAATALTLIVFVAIRWSWPPQRRVASAPEVPHGIEAVGERERTVAVLPFANISPDVADAYLAQGLPEMIIERMSHIEGLSVIARSSSFAASARSTEPRDLGRRLNAAYLVDGSVQRKANQLRLAVQLIDATAGTLIWSARFDRKMQDIFVVEDEISDQVASALAGRIGNMQPRPVSRNRSGNTEAFLAYLRGRALLGHVAVTDTEAALPYLEKAVALDPQFAAAYASLYDAHMQLADLRHDDPAPLRLRYRALIERALAIDPQSGAAYFARAMWARAPNAARELDFRRGAALDPSNGRGLTAYADFLAYGMGSYAVGMADESNRILKRALWVDPVSPSARLLDAEFRLWDSGSVVTERRTLEVLELDPDFVPALQRYAKFRWGVDGKLAEAIQYIERAIRLDPNNPRLRNTAMNIYLDLGDERAARDVAAGIPTGARADVPLAMYVGELQEAARAAYDQAGWAYNICENWLAAEALRDEALHSGDLERAMAAIKLHYGFAAAPAAHLDACSYHAAVYLSQLQETAGHAESASALRRAVSTWIDANADKYPWRTRQLRAAIRLLDGQRDAALAELRDSFRSGYSMGWWYTLEHDPLWLPLHGDPRFQAILVQVRRYIGAQRAELDTLRRRGGVPWRGAVHGG